MSCFRAHKPILFGYRRTGVRPRTEVPKALNQNRLSLGIDANGPDKRVFVRSYGSMYAVWSEFSLSLIPIQEGFMLGIKRPFGEKMPLLIGERSPQLIPAIDAVGWKDFWHRGGTCN